MEHYRTISEEELKGKKRKNTWGIIGFTFLAMFGAWCLFLFFLMFSKNDVINAKDVSHKEIDQISEYYIDDMVLVDCYGYRGTPGSIQGWYYMVTFKDKSGQRCYASLYDDGYTDISQDCFDYKNATTKQVGSVVLSGCFSLENYQQDDYLRQSDFNALYNKQKASMSGVNTKLSFVYDAKTPEEYRMSHMTLDIIIAILGGVLLLIAIWGIVSQIRKRKRLGEPEFLFSDGDVGEQQLEDDGTKRKKEQSLKRLRIVAWTVLGVAWLTIIMGVRLDNTGLRLVGFSCSGVAIICGVSEIVFFQQQLKEEKMRKKRAKLEKKQAKLNGDMPSMQERPEDIQQGEGTQVRGYKAAKVWFVLACVLAGCFLPSVFWVIATEATIGRIIVAICLFGGIPSVLVAVNYSVPILRKQKVLTDGGLSLQELEEDLANASYVKGTFGDYRIGNKVMAFSKKHIFLIDQVLWMYVQIERHYAYGVVKTATYRKIVVATRDKKIVRIRTNEQGEAAFKELVNKNAMKFQPDIMFGHTPMAQKRFKEFKKVRR